MHVSPQPAHFTAPTLSLLASSCAHMTIAMHHPDTGNQDPATSFPPLDDAAPTMPTSISSTAASAHTPSAGFGSGTAVVGNTGTSALLGAAPFAGITAVIMRLFHTRDGAFYGIMHTLLTAVGFTWLAETDPCWLGLRIVSFLLAAATRGFCAHLAKRRKTLRLTGCYFITMGFCEFCPHYTQLFPPGSQASQISSQSTHSDIHDSKFVASCLLKGSAIGSTWLLSTISRVSVYACAKSGMR